LVNEGAILGTLNRAEDALSVCDEVVHGFGQSDESTCLHQVAMALVNKGTTLEGLSRPEEARAVYDEIVHRFGESDSPDLYTMAEWTHLRKAEMELRNQRYETAIKTVDQVFAGRRTESLENRLRGHLIRAKATLATGNKAGSEQDIKAILAVLPQIESLPKAILDVLMASSVELGPTRICDLIQASPSASLLLPLTTALQQELGLEPRVAREVEEVARDIRRDLAKLIGDRTQK
jgi:tetratricopeptide (TPR) repeat protein